MENTQGGKFWGSESGCHACNAGIQTCWKTSYMFWINVGTELNVVACNA